MRTTQEKEGSRGQTRRGLDAPPRPPAEAVSARTHGPPRQTLEAEAPLEDKMIYFVFCSKLGNTLSHFDGVRIHFK